MNRESLIPDHSRRAQDDARPPLRAWTRPPMTPVISVTDGMSTAVDKDPSQCIIIADYKMKVEPSQNHESTAEHYGKRGISYHGVCAIYMERNETTGEYKRAANECSGTLTLC